MWIGFINQLLQYIVYANRRKQERYLSCSIAKKPEQSKDVARSFHALIASYRNVAAWTDA